MKNLMSSICILSELPPLKIENPVMKDGHRIYQEAFYLFYFCRQMKEYEDIM